MVRDFAKASPKPNRKRPATRKKPATRESTSAPAWIWLLTGTLLGALLVFLAYLSGIAPQPAQQAPQGAASESREAVEVPKPRFDFYTLLKESEVEVSSRPAEQRDATPQNIEEYILQVGSFKTPQEADRLRAELILLNMDAHVETVTVRNGQIWHRVLVGPFQSSSRVARARSQLASMDISPLLLKRKRQP